MHHSYKGLHRATDPRSNMDIKRWILKATNENRQWYWYILTSRCISITIYTTYQNTSCEFHWPSGVCWRACKIFIFIHRYCPPCTAYHPQLHWCAPANSPTGSNGSFRGIWLQRATTTQLQIIAKSCEPLKIWSITWNTREADVCIAYKTTW